MKRPFLLGTLLTFVLLTAVLVWQLPTILRAIPSRYVAAYAPESIQALAVREHVAVLPTAASTVDISSLIDLQPTATPAAPNSPTPLPTATSAAVSPASPTPSAVPPTPTATPIPFKPSARLTSINHHFQTWNNCGPATLAMGLSYFGLYRQQTETAAVLKPNPEDRNVSPYEMVNYVTSQTPFDALTRANGTLDTIRQLLSNGIPVIVETGIDPPGEYAWMDWYGHYLLVVAYDDARQTIWVYDSWLGNSDQIGYATSGAQGRPIDYATFERYWQQFNHNYIAMFEPAQRPLVTNIVGAEMDDAIMWQNGLERTKAALAQNSGDPYQWFNLGTNLNGLKEYEMAAVAFDQARALGLPWRMLWYQFGPYEAYYQVGRYQDVIELADVTLNQRPYFEESYYYRGLAYAALGDTSTAEDNLRRAAAFNPNFAPASAALATVINN